MEPSSSSREWIAIVDLAVGVRLGVSEQERKRPQSLKVCLRIFPAQPFARLEDRLDRTVDYAEVAQAVEEFARSKTFHLLETFAVELAQTLHRRFAPAAVEVEAKKYVLPQAAYVSARTILPG